VSFTRDVGAETAATPSSGGGYAGMKELTAGTRGQRERGSERGCGKAAALPGGPAGAERGGGRGARAGLGRLGRKAEGGRVVGFFPFSFILAFVFSFLFIYSI
jgi:hypothetical protein